MPPPKFVWETIIGGEPGDSLPGRPKTPKPKLPAVTKGQALRAKYANGKKPRPAKVQEIGSKLKVWNGTAKRTAAGLRRPDLMKSPVTGQIISIQKYIHGTKMAKHLGLKVKKT